MNEKWVKTLVFMESEEIENRILRILNYLDNKLKLEKKWIIKDVEATGDFGGELIEKF
jgi:hypothetical protein